MFNNRLVRLIVGLAIVAMAVLSISAALSTRHSTSSRLDNQWAPLDWYFAHDHAVLDGDNNVVSSGEDVGGNRFAPLDWYLAHDHAILDGDNNVVASSQELSH